MSEFIEIKTEPVFVGDESLKVESVPGDWEDDNYLLEENIVKPELGDSVVKAEPEEVEQIREWCLPPAYPETSSEETRVGNELPKDVPDIQLPIAERNTLPNGLGDLLNKQTKPKVSDSTKRRKTKHCQCKICHKVFGRMYHLNQHMLVHSGEKNNKCPLCPKRYRQKGTLRTHVLTVHTTERNYVCDVCLKTFNRPETLRIHKRFHSGERPFVCVLCGKKFVRQCHLINHMFSHTQQGNFACPECGKAFRRRNRLKLHLVTHTGEIPYSCDICGGRFTERRALKRHFLVHSGEKPFQCQVCSKTFTLRGYLQQHLLIHSGVKDFECDTCGMKFATKSGIKTHVRVHMRNNKTAKRKRPQTSTI